MVDLSYDSCCEGDQVFERGHFLIQQLTLGAVELQ